MAAPAVQIESESLVARIVEELRANPEAQKLLLRALLTDEFLGMPVRLERVEADVQDVKADVKRMNGRMDRMEADVQDVKADVKRMDGRMDRMEADVQDVKADVKRMDGRMDRMDGRMDRMEADVQDVKADVKRMDGRMDRMDGRMDRMENDVAVLKGDSLEAKCHRRIRPLISSRLGLHRTRILHSPLQETNPDLLSPVEQALARGVISDIQDDRLEETDIILSARRKADSSAVRVAVEVSNNIGQKDIERARMSADALSAVFRQDAVAVVAGYRVHPRDQERADDMNVHLLIVDEND